MLLSSDQSGRKLSPVFISSGRAQLAFQSGSAFLLLHIKKRIKEINFNEEDGR